MRIIFTLLMFSSLSVLSFAQGNSLFSQYFKIDPSSDVIHLDIKDAYEVVPSSHESNILVEAKIVLEKCDDKRLKNMIDIGIFNLILVNDGANISTLKFVLDRYKQVKGFNGTFCNETIKLKIHVPSVYERISDTEYRRVSSSILATKGG